MHSAMSHRQSAVGVDSCSLDLGGEGVDQTGKEGGTWHSDVGLGDGGVSKLYIELLTGAEALWFPWQPGWK